MTQDQAIILAFRIVLIAIEVGVVLFIVVYSRLAPWWKNPIGKTIVILDALIGIGFIPSILSLFFQFNRLTSHISAWLTVGIFSLVAIALVHRSFLWVKLHKTRKDEAENA